MTISPTIARSSRVREARHSARPQSSSRRTPGQPNHEAFRPELQGLRALAVGLVVVYHLWPKWLTGGYVGVDVFFVLSGYLITSHMLREIGQTGGLRITRFWARRIRRLLPASLLVLVLSAITVLLFAPATLWQQSGRQIAASALYVQNWALAFDAVDYMALDNVPTMAQHYWSLSVEEQFYAVWPLLIVGLLGLQRRALARRRTSPALIRPTPDQQRRILIAGLALVALTSLVWSVWSTAQDQPFAYMSTFTRAWEFAAGALTALCVVALGRFAVVAGWVGVVAIAFAGFAFTNDSMFPGWIALVPVLGTVAVILAGRGGRNSAGWWLSVAPLRFIGDISYSIYLIHWPLVIGVPYVTGHVLSWPEKLAILVVSVAAAWLSKTFVEDPLRVRPLLAAAPWRAFAFAFAGMLVLVTANVGLKADLGHREALAAQVAAAQLSGSSPCMGPSALVAAHHCTSVAGDGPPVVPPEVVGHEAYLEIFPRCQQDLASADLKTCHLGQSKDPLRTVALVGDSHASAMAPLMDRLGKQLGWEVLASTKSSCPATSARRVLRNETNDRRQVACETFNAEVSRQILENPAITDVFVTSFTSAYGWANIPGSALADPGVDGFQTTWKRWTDAGKRVHVLRDIPLTGHRDIPSCLEVARSHPETCSRPRSDALAADLAVTAARAMRNPKVSVVDLTPEFCDTTTCFAQVGNVIAYRDYSHMSVEYAELLAPFVAKQLGRLG